MFCDILVRKNAFLDYKKKSSKCRKIGICAKGLVIVFVIKLKCFYSFILSKIGKKKRVSRYLRYKKGVLDYKVRDFDSVGKLEFFQRG